MSAETSSGQRVTQWQLILMILTTRPLWRLLIMATSLLATSLGLLGPFLQKEYLDVLLHRNSSSGFGLTFLEPGSPPWVLMIFSFVAILGYLGFNLLTTFLGNREAIFMQKILAQKLYQRILSLRSDSLYGRSVGEFVAAYATDVSGATILLEQTLPQGASILFPILLTPFVLFKFLGLPLLELIAMIAVVGILNFFLAYRQSYFFSQFKSLAAERIGIVTEWIQNIRILRILGWVESFETKIKATRIRETDNRITMVTNGQVMNSLASSITFILNIAVISSLVFSSKEPVSSGTLFALLWIVAVFLTRPFRQMPWVFTFVFDAWTSIARLAEILSLENSNEKPRQKEFSKLPEVSNRLPAIKVQNLNLVIGEKEILKSIDLEIRTGEFVAIVGEVGSGKSQVLLSLMGENTANFAEYLLFGIDAQKIPLEQLRQFYTFVPQEGFIMSASLRENVAFDYNVSIGQDKQILRCLQRSQFDPERERAAEGLNTEIGERGVNLSGGQKQRVSLARVDYHASPIILLDDCLSALDVDTEDQLIAHLLKGSWKDRTRILATHRLTVLPEVDRVVFIENGKKVGDGTYAHLMQSNEKFRQYTSSITAQTHGIPEFSLVHNPRIRSQDPDNQDPANKGRKI